MSKAKEFLDSVEEGKLANTVMTIAAWLAATFQVGVLPRADLRQRAAKEFSIDSDSPSIDKAIDKFLKGMKK